jgi:O-antigen/teichoic acid export membrane protein
VVILSTLADGGFQMVTVRDLAPAPGKSLAFFRKSLRARLLLSLLGGLGLVGWGLTGSGETFPWWLLGLSVFLLLPEAFLKAGQAVLTARERMDLTSGLSLVQALAATCLIGGVVLLGRGLPGAAVTLCLINLAAAGAAIWLVRPFLLGAQEEPRTSWQLFKTAFPYGLLALLTIIYFRIDVIMLAGLKGAQEAGHYNAALRLFEAGVIIPSALAGALFPVMSRQLASREMDGLLLSHTQALKLMGLIAMPAAAAGWRFSPWLVDLFFGPDYGPAGPVLALLSVCWVLFFINIPLGNLLAASNLMPKFVPWAAANTGLNVVLNLLLIPPLGAVGAVAATLACEVVGLAVQYHFAWRILEVRPPLAGLFLRPGIAAGLVLAAWLWVDAQLLPEWLSLGLGLLLYAGLVVILRGVTGQDWKYLRRVASRLGSPEPA